LLNETDFLLWCQRLALTEKAQTAVIEARSRNPTRRVGGGRQNVSGRYPSRKMGVTIQFESHRVELPFVYELERDATVLEYYDQPPSIPLSYPAANGRALSVVHTPDYFVIRQDSAGWEECKTSEDLEKLALKSPNRYCRDSEGKWCCPPGQAYALTTGLYYRVRSSDEIDWVLQRNLQFLEDYLRFDHAGVDGFVDQAVKAAVQTEPGILLGDLLERAKGVAKRDDIYLLIASGEIYVDLGAAAMVEPERVRVFANPDTAAAHQHASLDLQRSVGTSGTRTSRVQANGEAFRLLTAASEQELKVANERFELVKRHMEGEAAPTAVPARTLRLWLAQYRLATEKYGNGYVGLLPKTGGRGNRNLRLPEASHKLLAEFIANDYESLKQKTRAASWAALKRACEERGIVAPSYVSFCLAVRERPAFEQILKRQGRRAAYAHAEFYFELQLTTPRHGDRPFEIGHIDHTELDVEVVCSLTGRPLGRPWMTILTDAFSRRGLSLYLTFDAPSYRSCMMILRECVRRHGRLPQILVIDGGPEFQSTYFETLLARYEVTKKTRPPAQARFGSVCERLFGTTNTQFIHNLRGNTQITRNVRQVTKSVSPQGQAVWTLGALEERLSEYFLEIYDTVVHPALSLSPREAFTAGLESSGLRLQRLIPYDEDFLMATLPTTTKGVAKVLPGRGVKVNQIYYWSDRFRNPAVEGTCVAVRYDPFDAGAAYAFVERQWVRCYSEHHLIFQGRSEKEILLASHELRRRNQVCAGGKATTARKLADFLQSVESEELLLEQRMRDREGQSARRASLNVVPDRPDNGADLQTPPWTDPSPCVATPPAYEMYGEF
jgi:transposase InsO family protein